MLSHTPTAKIHHASYIIETTGEQKVMYYFKKVGIVL